MFYPLGKMGEGLFTALMQIEDQDCPASECTSHLTLDPGVDHALKALQLTEALRGVLEGQGSEQEQHSLRKQVSTETAHIILKWLHRDEVSTVSLTAVNTVNTVTRMDKRPEEHYTTLSMQI